MTLLEYSFNIVRSLNAPSPNILGYEYTHNTTFRVICGMGSRAFAPHVIDYTMAQILTCRAFMRAGGIIEGSQGLRYLRERPSPAFWPTQLKNWRLGHRHDN